MIIWLNGAFGSGKTQTAHELHRRIENSYIYDPENAGFYIRENIPLNLKKNDFQDFPMWREFNYKMLKYMHDNFHGVIIVPMTITNNNYYDEIITRLTEDKILIEHYILYAQKETILKRLGKRFESKNSWAANQIDRCLYSFDNEITETKIHTDEMSIYEVVEEVACKSAIRLEEDKRNFVKRKIDRIITQIKYVR